MAGWKGLDEEAMRPLTRGWHHESWKAKPEARHWLRRRSVSAF